MMGLALPVAVRAQEVGVVTESDLPQVIDRGRNIGVLDRPRPEYEPTGIRRGSFKIYPSVDLAVGYLDNIYGASTDAKADGFGQITPSVAIVSDWASHYLKFYGNAQLQRYFSQSIENQTAYTLNAEGRLDVTRENNIFVSAESRHAFEPRYSDNSPDNAQRPVAYDRRYGLIRGTYEADRIRAGAAFSVTRLTYGDAQSRTGLAIDQSFRDHTMIKGSTSGEYGLTPDASIITQFSFARVNYDSSTPATDRSSNDIRLLAGINLDLTSLLRGRFTVGYVDRNFRTAAFGSIKGLAADFRFQYFLTPLTTFTIAGSRFVEDSTIDRSGGYFSEKVEARADHELLRNLLLNAGVTYERDRYKGVDRADQIYSISGGARYLANPMMEFGFSVAHSARTSSGAAAGAGIKQTQMLVSVTFKR
jgi:hypothetical protein